MPLKSPDDADRTSEYTRHQAELVQDAVQVIADAVDQSYSRGKTLKISLPGTGYNDDTYQKIRDECGAEWDLKFEDGDLQKDGPYYSVKITAAHINRVGGPDKREMLAALFLPEPVAGVPTRNEPQVTIRYQKSHIEVYRRDEIRDKLHLVKFDASKGQPPRGKRGRGGKKKR